MKKLNEEQMKRILGGYLGNTCTADCGGYTVSIDCGNENCSAYDTDANSLGFASCHSGRLAHCDHKKSTPTPSGFF